MPASRAIERERRRVPRVGDEDRGLPALGGHELLDRLHALQRVAALGDGHDLVHVALAQERGARLGLGRAVALPAAADGDDARRDAVLVQRAGVLQPRLEHRARLGRRTARRRARRSRRWAAGRRAGRSTRPPRRCRAERRGGRPATRAATRRRTKRRRAAPTECRCCRRLERRRDRPRAGRPARGTASTRRSPARRSSKKWTLSGSPPCSPQTPIFRPGRASRPSSTAMRTSRPTPATVDRLEGADAEDAEVEVAREERGLDVVAAEAAAHLRQVVGAEGEEVGGLGDLRRAVRAARGHLDHRADQRADVLAGALGDLARATALRLLADDARAPAPPTPAAPSPPAAGRAPRLAARRPPRRAPAPASRTARG